MANQAVEALINRVREAKGSVPSVNPPTVAARILETETRAEVNQTAPAAPAAPAAEQAEASTPGTAESVVPDVQVAPEAVASVIAEATGVRTRRTAAVVQAELDLALKELATAGEQIAALKAGAPHVEGYTRASLEALVAELKRRGFGVYSIP